MSRVHPTAEISADAVVDPSASVWQHAHVRERAHVGADSVVGRGAYVGPGVLIGARFKMQNYALVYEPAVLADGVFIGPAVVLTNDLRPRAVNPDCSLKSASDWDPVGVTIAAGASIGARATCVAPVRIGRWAMVGAGSVVVRDVPDYALVAGNPAHQIGWVGPSGERLVEEGSGRFVCPRTHQCFHLTAEGVLVEEPQ